VGGAGRETIARSGTRSAAAIFWLRRAAATAWSAGAGRGDLNVLGLGLPAPGGGGGRAPLATSFSAHGLFCPAARFWAVSGD
jgi:hypothetical protein